VGETFPNYYIKHAVRMFKITCNTQAHNNFKVMFQLITIGFLNTEQFQNLKYKYSITSKGFLEHLKALLYPTVLEISMFSVKLQDTNGVR